MKFGRYIYYKRRNIFLEKSHTKCGGESNSRPLKFAFIAFQVVICQNKLKLRCRPLAFISYKAFKKKTKKVLEKSSVLIFCIIFGEEYFSCYTLLTDQISLTNCLYFLGYWTIMYCDYQLSACDIIHFEISLSFLIKLSKYLENQKSF